MIRLATLDCETDPFKVDRVPRPFVWDFFDGKKHEIFWGEDCTKKLVAHLRSLENEYIIYAHNGGGFDFYFFLWALERDSLLINSRIVKTWLGKQELRDSYAIFPDPLSAYKKDDFNYKLMEEDVRENHKQEIIRYLKNDCLYLYEIVTRFHEEFGDHLTIGSCAMKQLKKFHSFETATRGFHERISPFYFGGRNQCFKSGVIKGNYNLYDINSQYPFVMRNFKHPISNSFDLSGTIGKRTGFALITAKNSGCLPRRIQGGSLSFREETGDFYASIHEIEAGLDTGTLEIIKVKCAFDFKEWSTFDRFIDAYADKKINARKTGDDQGYLFYKRIQNSCYGKFAQNPENHEDCCIIQNDVLGEPWIEKYRREIDGNSFAIYAQPSAHKTYFNIATGASITGAARSVLLRALVKCDDPLYCDTDSIICRKLHDVEIDQAKLGAWKHEGEISKIAIAGKKLYAAIGKFEKGKTEKKAHKGAVLTSEQIFEIAENGDANFKGLLYEREAPKFRLNGESVFVKRRIKRTVQA